MHISEIWHSKKNDYRLSRTQVIRCSWVVVPQRNILTPMHGQTEFNIKQADTPTKDNRGNIILLHIRENDIVPVDRY